MRTIVSGVVTYGQEFYGRRRRIDSQLSLHAEKIANSKNRFNEHNLTDEVIRMLVKWSAWYLVYTHTLVQSHQSHCFR